MPKITITIQAELDELEAECFRHNLTDDVLDEDFDGQADTIKDILQNSIFANINWKIESTFKPWYLIGIK